MSLRHWTYLRLGLFGIAIVAGLILFIHGLLQMFGWQGLWESQDRYSGRAMAFFDGDGIRIFKRLSYFAIGATLVWFPWSAICEELRDE